MTIREESNGDNGVDSLNRIWTQIQSALRGMPTGARVTSALLVAAIAVGLVFTFQHGWIEKTAYLFGAEEFSHRDIQTMLTAFAQEGLNDAEVVGARIRVPLAKRDSYLKALADHQAIPRDPDDPFAQWIKNSSPFEPNSKRKLEAKFATEQKVALMIAKMSGVEAAWVQFDEARTGGLYGHREVSAVVTVRGEGRRHLDREQVASIRNMVVSAVVGLKPEQVTISDAVASRAYKGDGPEAFGEADDVYARTKRLYERDWTEKLYDQFRMYPGIIVGVNVTLNDELSQKELKNTYDPKPVGVQSESYTKSTESEPVVEGPVGARNNLVGNRPLSVKSSHSSSRAKSEESRERLQSVLGSQQVSMERAGLTPKNVTVSIRVPNQIYVEQWKQENPAEKKEPTIAQLDAVKKSIDEDIRKTVDNLLVGEAPGDEPLSRVVVTSFTQPAAPESTPTEPANTAFAWFAENWQSLALILLASVGLFIFRGAFKPAPSAPLDTHEVLSRELEITDGDDVESEAAKSERRLKRPTGAINLKDELAELVREDPNVAAGVLRSWIGDAA